MSGDTEKRAGFEKWLGKLSRKVVFWFKGHDPDLSLCRKAVIPYREQDCGFIVFQMMGRTLYFGPTQCKRCRKTLHGEM